MRSLLSNWRRTAPLDTGAAPAFSGRARIALLAAFALLVVFRLPAAWQHGRFLDEEGSVFFAYAWHRPLGEALLRPFGGYLNLGANLPTALAARLVQAGVLPLRFAPYPTMTTALLFQLIPAVLLLTARARWLARRWAVVAALLIVVASPLTEEVFANVLHIQFHLALAVALLLALDPARSAAGRAAGWTILFIAPLCGPGAIVLLPLFAVRAIADRDLSRLAQTVALGAGAALQLLVFFTPSPVRGELLDPATLAAVMAVRLVALPFLSISRVHRIEDAVFASYASGTIWWYAAVLAFLLYVGALAWFALRRPRDPAIWLILGALAIATASFGGGMIVNDPREWFSTGSGERYNFLPLVLLGLAVVALAARERTRYRYAYLVLTVLALWTGVRAYVRPIPELSGGPVWPEEVARWQRDRTYPLRVWPDRWTVDLSDHHRSCAPLPAGIADLSQPSYCEGPWVRRVMPKGRVAK